MTLSSKGRLGADYAGVPWPRHMLSQPWIITEQTPSAEGSLRPERPKPTLQADNSTRLTACQEGLVPGPWKFTLTTPNPGTASHNLPIHTVHIPITDKEKFKNKSMVKQTKNWNYVGEGGRETTTGYRDVCSRAPQFKHWSAGPGSWRHVTRATPNTTGNSRQLSGISGNARGSSGYNY